MHQNTLHSWVNKARSEQVGTHSEAVSDDEREELKFLRRENRILREERESSKSGGSLLRQGVLVNQRYQFIDRECNASDESCRR